MNGIAAVHVGVYGRWHRKRRTIRPHDRLAMQYGIEVEIDDPHRIA
jgi:hypothetical protein